MKTYVINGPKGVGKTDFSVNLAEYLQKNSKVLLLQAKREANSNIEDYFQKDGMITYDLGDYFSSLAPLSKVLVNESNNLDFIISPLMEDKYDLTKEDMDKLISQISYDYLILDGVDKSFIDEKVSVDIIGEVDLDYVKDSDAFFINKVSEDFDVRNIKNEIESKSSKFLGTVKNDEYFNLIIENLLNDKPVAIPKLGFFERLKLSFKK